MAGRLQGKVAIITGGNSGIGEATAHRFAQEGAHVAILARRAQEGETVQQRVAGKNARYPSRRSVPLAGSSPSSIPCDVTDRAAVEAAVVRTLDTYGALHVLFNNAGGASREVFPEESDEGWDRVLRVNLTGTCLMRTSRSQSHKLLHLLMIPFITINMLNNNQNRINGFQRGAECAS
jgi:NAD(P)-dependent dehydrogenase (short-subunit alcohol dehydrogenase family)